MFFYQNIHIVKDVFVVESDGKNICTSRRFSVIDQSLEIKTGNYEDIYQVIETIDRR